jgi:hypothetical protein
MRLVPRALFVANGASDDAVPPRIIAARVKALYAKGATVSYKSYPGNHGTMMQSSFSDQMSWIADRPGEGSAQQLPMSHCRSATKSAGAQRRDARHLTCYLRSR